MKVNKTIKAMGIALLGSTFSMVALSGCQPHEGSENQLKADVESFAIYYYNWHFPKALPYCTPESEQWLRYAASNVHEADIELLRNKAEDASIEIGDVDFGDDEVSAIVNVKVSNFLQMDTIGREAHLVNEATFQIPMQIHNGKWKVKLENLPSGVKE